MMNRYFLMDEMGLFMVLNLTEKQAKAIQKMHDSYIVDGFIFDLFDETKFKKLKENNPYWKDDCLSIYHKFEIPENDDTVIFEIMNFNKCGASKVFKGTRSQYEIIDFISSTRFCEEIRWYVDFYKPPTIVDIR